MSRLICHKKFLRKIKFKLNYLKSFSIFKWFIPCIKDEQNWRRMGENFINLELMSYCSHSFCPFIFLLSLFPHHLLQTLHDPKGSLAFFYNFLFILLWKLRNNSEFSCKLLIFDCLWVLRWWLLNYIGSYTCSSSQ